MCKVTCQTFKLPGPDFNANRYPKKKKAKKKKKVSSLSTWWGYIGMNASEMSDAARVHTWLVIAFLKASLDFSFFHTSSQRELTTIAGIGCFCGTRTRFVKIKLYYFLFFLLACFSWFLGTPIYKKAKTELVMCTRTLMALTKSW